MERYIAVADSITAWFGKAFAWCILIMTFGIGYEVFVRYVLRDPTSWAFDLSYMMYGSLFMMAGALQERLHTREMTEMGGLWVKAPRMGAVALFFVVASLGMPGLGTFVGEFLVLLGAFQVDIPLTVAAAAGMIIAAVYSLSLMQRTFQGPANPNVGAMRDFGARELSVMILMAVGLIWLGVYPQGVLDLSSPVLDVLQVGMR